jgi:hypothetical protein
MPLYFFEFQHRKSRLRDHEGQPFSGPVEAERHARQVAYELARNNSPASLDGKFVVLLDGERNKIIAISLMEVNEGVVSPPKTQRPVH